MKSQDIFILFKLASIEQQIACIHQDWETYKDKKEPLIGQQSGPHQMDCRQPLFTQYYEPAWQDWEKPEEHFLNDFSREHDSFEVYEASRLSVRGLAAETGISKSEVSLSLKRSYFAGLAKPDRRNELPKPNLKALLEFVAHGLRYAFPVKPAELTRGIATALAAPVLKGKLMTAGELISVWPDAYGNSKGQTIAPLFKSVPFAVRKDPQLYEYLALADAIRLGQPRERILATELLEKTLMRKH